MELSLGKELCEMNLDEAMMINGGEITTAEVAGFFVAAAGTVVGAVVGGAVGGPVGAAIAGEKGAQVGALIGSIVVGYLAEEATIAVINGMAAN